MGRGLLPVDRGLARVDRVEGAALPVALDRLHAHHRRGCGDLRVPWPDVRPRCRRHAAHPHDRAEAARDAHAARGAARHQPGLLPGDDEFPLLAVDPARDLHAPVRLDLHRDAGRLQSHRAPGDAARAARSGRHAAGAGAAGDDHRVRPFPARLRPAVGAAAGRARRHLGAFGFDDTGQHLPAHPVRCARLPGGVRGPYSPLLLPLLARAGAREFRRTHLEDRRVRAHRLARVFAQGAADELHGHHRAARQAVALRPRRAGRGPARLLRAR